MLTISTINYRNWRATAQCIRHLLAACDGLEFRILVRDNSENPETDELRRELVDVGTMLYFESPHNPGFGQGHNRNFQAVAHGPDDVFLVLNNDVRIYDKQAIKAMLQACRPNRIVSCVLLGPAGTIWYSGGRIHRLTGDLILDREILDRPLRSTEFVSGGCLMLPANLYQSLGGFDEGFFMYAEDLDLCLRTRTLGVELVVVNHTIIHEVGSGERGRYSNLYLYENTKNRLVCLRRHRLGYAGISLAYFVWKYGVLRAAQLAILSPEPRKQIGAAWRGLWDGYFHTPQCRVAEFQNPASRAT